MIQNIIDKIKNNESLESKASRSCTKRITDERTGTSIFRAVLGSAEKRQKIGEAVRSELAAGGIEISARTVRRRLVQSDQGSHLTAKKPRLRKKNFQWRLRWTQKSISWNEQNCSKVLCSDESGFNVFGCKESVRVRREQRERYHLGCVQKTVKHGGGKIMVWGLFYF